MKTYYIHTLGCKVNSYESSALGIGLRQMGYELAKKVEDADVMILNTCSVTGRADQKSRQHISSMRSKNPRGVLLVMGCYSQSNAEQSLTLGANIVLGSSDRSLAIGYIAQFFQDGKPIVDVKKSVRKESYEELGVNVFCENARAYLKVQDGCDNFCSYCYIPFLRGNSRSREPRHVIEEAKALVEDGYREIVITGIHIGAYGKDLGNGAYRLADLLEDILVACPSLYRLRISSIEESEIDDHFLDLLKRYPTIASHLHIPLQSGSSAVLERMKRHYDTSDFLKKLQAIRLARPGIAITTDVIAGFPGETDEQWLETLSFCRKAAFAGIHVFPFSSRPGTFAATLKDTDPAVKKRRVDQLLALSKELREEYEAPYRGEKLEVLFEDYDKEAGIAYGHSSNYLKVGVAAKKPRHGEVDFVLYDHSTASD